MSLILPWWEDDELTAKQEGRVPCALSNVEVTRRGLLGDVNNLPQPHALRIGPAPEAI